MLKENTTTQNMLIRFKTSLKRVFNGELLVEVYLLTDARGKENITHPVLLVLCRKWFDQK